MAEIRPGFTEIDNVHIANTNEVGEMLLYGIIGQRPDFWDESIEAITGEAIAKALNQLVADGCTTINVRINSIGGNVLEGNAIINSFNSCEAKIITHNDGVAASMGAVIWATGAERHMAKNSTLMIHSAGTFCVGNSHDMRRKADLLDVFDGILIDTIAAGCGKSSEVVKAELFDGEDHWFNVKAVKAFGFEVVEDSKESIERVEPEPAAARVARAQAQMKTIHSSYRALAVAAMAKSTVAPQNSNNNPEIVTPTELTAALADGSITLDQVNAALAAHAGTPPVGEESSTPPAGVVTPPATPPVAPETPPDAITTLTATLAEIQASNKALSERLDAALKDRGDGNQRVPAPSGNPPPQGTDGEATSALASLANDLAADPNNYSAFSTAHTH